jgi:hypothetical protein
VNLSGVRPFHGGPPGWKSFPTDAVRTAKGFRMDTFFTWCAVVGGIVFLGQFALSLLGQGHAIVDAPDLDLDLDGPDLDLGSPDGDVTHFDLDGGDMTIGHAPGADVWFVGMFSLRAILAGITVFGLVGRALPAEYADYERTILGLAAGGWTMYAMGWLVRRLHRFEHDGTVRLRDTLGTEGTVYLSIPGSGSGAGKVTLTVKGRTMEYAAITPSSSLETGTPVKVVGIHPPSIVEVEAVTKEANEIPA